MDMTMIKLKKKTILINLHNTNVFLYIELVLLCYVCYSDFKYLQDGYIKNLDTIWQQKLFCIDENIDGLVKYKRYSDELSLSVYSREHWNCSLLTNIVHCVQYIWDHQQLMSVDIFPRGKILFTFHLHCLFIV